MPFSGLGSHILYIIFPAIAIWLSSCAHLARTLGLTPKAPVVELTGINVRQVSLAAIALDISLDVRNEDDREIDACDLDVALRYEDALIGSSKLASCVTVPAKGLQQITAPVTLETRELLRAALALSDKANHSKVRAVGNLRLKTWLGYVPLSFDRPLKK